jgi:predicted dehydrogenase
MSALRVILVGLGARSRIWIRILSENPRTRLVGIVDTDPARVAEVLGHMPDLVSGATLGEVAGRVAADAAILVTPPGNRHAQIADACAAGLAILAEKPLADSLAYARRHVDAAARAGVPLMVGLNFRYLAVTRALKSLFADDRLGAPAFGRFTYERWRDGTQARLNKYPLTMDQPMLWEQSVHHFDLMRHVYGSEATGIAARTFNPPWSMYRDDANVAALITFANGVEVTYQGTWAGNWDNLGFNWRTDCARGIAIQAEMFGNLSFAHRHDAALTPVALPDTEIWHDDAADLLAEFVAHLLDGKALACSGEDHLNSLRMVAACIASATQKTTINPAELNDLAEPVGRTPDFTPTEKRTS